MYDGGSDDFADSAAILGDLGARPQLARVLRGWAKRSMRLDAGLRATRHCIGV